MVKKMSSILIIIYLCVYIFRKIKTSSGVIHSFIRVVVWQAPTVSGRQGEKRFINSYNSKKKKTPNHKETISLLI